jgi:hypothetical protein
MNKIKSIVVASLALTVGLVSCDSGNMRRTPGHIYAPDMTYSRAYDAYTSNPNFEDGLTSRRPVSGTIARGHEMPDHMVEGDTAGYKSFNTELRFTENELDEGRRLFNIYCGICHGTGLDGQGPLYASGKFASMPANLKDAKYLHMPSGQMYAAIKYGKNMMGAYASQLDIKQRWMVIAYIKKIQSENGGDAFAYGATKAAPVEVAAAPAPAAEEKAPH